MSTVWGKKKGGVSPRPHPPHCHHHAPHRFWCNPAREGKAASLTPQNTSPDSAPSQLYELGGQLCDKVGEGTAAPGVVPQLSFSYNAPPLRDRVLTCREPGYQLAAAARSVTEMPSAATAQPNSRPFSASPLCGDQVLPLRTSPALTIWRSPFRGAAKTLLSPHFRTLKCSSPRVCYTSNLSWSKLQQL